MCVYLCWVSEARTNACDDGFHINVRIEDSEAMKSVISIIKSSFNWTVPRLVPYNYRRKSSVM